MIITGHLPRGLLNRLCQLPTSSLSHILGWVTPIHLPGCDVSCSGSLSWSIKLGWVLISDVDAPSRSPQAPFLFLCAPPWLPSVFPFGRFLLPAACQDNCPGPTGASMCGVVPLQQSLANDWKGGSLKAHPLLLGQTPRPGLYSQLPTYEPSRCELLKMWTPPCASCIVLLCFSRHYTVRLKMFSLRTHGCWGEGIVRDFGKVRCTFLYA